MPPCAADGAIVTLLRSAVVKACRECWVPSFSGDNRHLFRCYL